MPRTQLRLNVGINVEMLSESLNMEVPHFEVYGLLGDKGTFPLACERCANGTKNYKRPKIGRAYEKWQNT